MKKMIFLLATLLSGTANSALVDQGNHIYDSSSHLDWLKITPTIGLSYNEVVSQMATGGSFAGWRYATTAEFRALIEGYTGQLFDGVYHEGGYQQSLGVTRETADNLTSLFGTTASEIFNGQNDYYRKTLGMLADDFDWSKWGRSWGIDRQSAIIFDETVTYNGTVNQDLFSSYVIRINDNTFKDNEKNHDVGSFLVRTDATVSSVPLPPSVFLFAIGLVGLGLGRRRVQH